METLGGIAPRQVNAVNALPPALADRGQGQQSPFAGTSGFVGLGDYGRQDGRVAGTDANGSKIGTGGELVLADSVQLSPEAQQQLRSLRQRDAEVRAHEQAHVAAGGAHVVGGPNYVYQQGPDGKQYAIGGEVSIDTSTVQGDPEATAEKARQVRRAALAPAQPSAADRQVAAEAATTEAEARRDERVEDRAESRVESRENQTQNSHAASGVEDFLASERTADGLAGLDSPEASERTDRLTMTDRAMAARMEEQQADNARQRHYGQESEGQAMQRAAWAYAAMSQRGIMPTTLAPGGTGISLLV